MAANIFHAPHVPPGLYRHNKTGNHYRVLFEAEWIAGSRPDPDDEVSVVVVDNTWLGVHKDYGPISGMYFDLLKARWSGNSSTVDPTEQVVVYVSVDGGKGRLSVRTCAEFVENVVIDGKMVPRFERVGE